jgi:hypothetical protein
MVGLFFILGIIGLIGGFLFFIGGLIEGEGWIAGLGLGALVIGIILTVSTASLDKPYVLANGNVNTEYGVLKDVSGNYITVDKVKIKYDAFEKVRGFKIGDIVKVNYGDGALDNYLVNIEKYEGSK